jgi:hypothetical protein
MIWPASAEFLWAAQKARHADASAPAFALNTGSHLQHASTRPNGQSDWTQLVLPGESKWTTGFHIALDAAQDFRPCSRTASGELAVFLKSLLCDA